MNNRGAAVDISGMVGAVGGDIVGGNKITINIVSPIGKIIESKTPPGPNMYVDRKHQFSVGWPEDSDWIPSSRMGAYQLAQFGVVNSQEFKLFGLFKREFQATFAVFKIQRPQNACVGWVIIDIYPMTFGIPNVSTLADLVAAFAIKSVKISGGEIISQSAFIWNGTSWRPSETPAPEIVYKLIPNPDPGLTRIIKGDSHVYAVSSPVYSSTPAYENLRQETNAVLNSFTLLR